MEKRVLIVNLPGNSVIFSRMLEIGKEARERVLEVNPSEFFKFCLFVSNFLYKFYCLAMINYGTKVLD
jgi:hypothetical protein